MSWNNRLWLRRTAGALVAASWIILAACQGTRATQSPSDDALRSLPLVYEQDFESPASLGDFVFSDPAAWRLGRTDDGACLEQHAQSKYAPPHRSPLNIALLATPAVGSFVLEADLMQTGRDYAHRDMCVFFCVQSPSRYCYAHISRDADENAHNVFRVDEAPRRSITKTRSDGVAWGRDTWHRVRVAFDAGKHEVRVYFDDMNEPILVSESVPFTSGYVGFGTFDDEGRVDNVRLWADGVASERAGFFRAADER